MNIIYSILWFGALIFGIWFMISRKRHVQAPAIPDQQGQTVPGQPSLEVLTGKEKLTVWLLCLFNPVLMGVILYFGWKRKLPQKARTANRISFAAFAIVILIWFAQSFYQVKKVGVQETLDLAKTQVQIENLDNQAKAITQKADPEDQADIQAIKEKIGIGYDRALPEWQLDAKWYAYRRIYTLSAAHPEQILKDVDSYYYESRNTNDNYEELFDRKSNNVIRVDINPNRISTYVENFADVYTINVGPKKALEIAMLSPSLQKFKNENPEHITQV